MSNPSSGGRGGGRGKSKQSGNKQLIDSLREACPAHKQNDLEALVKSLKGDEAKIREKISEWWEEPVVAVEGDWEDVNKKSSQSQKPPPKFHKQQGRGRGAADSGGRGRSARGSGREGRGRGRTGERGPNKEPKHDEGNQDVKASTAPPATPAGIPTAGNVRAPQGAWAKKTVEPEPSPSAPVPEPVAPQPAPVVEAAPQEVAPPPAPSPPVPTPAPVPTKLAGTTGNVWATRGSAHLIQKEMPKPPPAPAPISRKSNGSRKSDRVAPTVDAVVVTPPQERSPPPVPKEVVAPSPVAPPAPGLAAPSPAAPPANAWNQEKSNPVPSPAAPTQPIGSAPEQKGPTNKVEAPVTNVLNMGRWETGDADDNLDFGFGSFGNDNATNDGDAKAESAPPAAAASPARPPPGLSITGMPPMPTNAVLVHELENKLEEVSVSKQQQQVQDNQAIPGLPAHQQPHSQQPHMGHDVSHLSAQPSYGSNQYGAAAGMGMYGNYNAGGAAVPGHAFVGMPGAGGPGLGAPQQPPLKGPPQQQPGLYNSAPSSGNAPVVGAAGAVNDTTGPSSNAATGMPPGMPGMPYGNPMYYGQQQFHMGQHQPGIGYNYGYGGQFAGGVQGGFGYPGGMHGNAGYGHGAPQYDDGVGATAGAHGPPGSAGGGVGVYNPQQQQQQQQPKNTGSYRGGGGGGRHNNSNNQYQQYNPQQQHHQHGGYGAQPYGMGYHGDHFNQRGGYGNMQDPYGMQQQQQQGVGNYGGGGFQGDNQYKGKKGNRGGLNQFQQGPPNQQPFGLQGQGQGGSESNQQSADGWTNQGGGWSGGSSGWQGK